MYASRTRRSVQAIRSAPGSNRAARACCGPSPAAVAQSPPATAIAEAATTVARQSGPPK